MPLHHCISTKETSDKKQAKCFFFRSNREKISNKKFQQSDKSTLLE